MGSVSTKVKCEVCANPDPLCSKKLGIPICSVCWKNPNPKKMGYFSWTPELDKINDKIFIGSEETQHHKAILKTLGITNIIVVGIELEILYPNEFEYHYIGIHDFHTVNISKYFDQSYEFIERSKGNVLVHCAAGISRSATIVIAYLMRKERKSFEIIMNYVKERRNAVNPNEGFVKQLIEFGEKINGTEKNNTDP